MKLVQIIFATNVEEGLIETDVVMMAVSRMVTTLVGLAVTVCVINSVTYSISSLLSVTAIEEVTIGNDRHNLFKVIKDKM